MKSLRNTRVTGSASVVRRRRGVRQLSAVAVACTAASVAAVAPANTVYTWTGGATAADPASGVWSVGTNWSGGVAPSSTGASTDTELDFGGLGADTYTSSNDVGPLSVTAVQLFSTSTGTDAIDGSSANNPINFVPNGTANPTVLQNGSGPFTFNGPITVAAPASNTSAGLLTVSGTGTGPVTFAGPMTFNAYATNTSTAAVTNGAYLSLTKPGVTNITGAVTFMTSNATGAALPFDGGVSVTAGTLNVAGSASVSLVNTTVGTFTATQTTAPNLQVGGPTGQAVVNLTTGGTVNFVTPDVGGQYLPAATATNPTSRAAAGAVYQSAGTFVYTGANGSVTSNFMQLGSGYTAAGATGGYGAYVLTGGTLTANGQASGGGIRVGAVGLGVYLQTGGAATPARYLQVGTVGQGVATFAGGTFTTTSGSATNAVSVGDTFSTGFGVFNLGTQAGGNATFSDNSTQTGGVGTGSGSVTAEGFIIGNGTATGLPVGIVNLNAGTLQLAGGIGRGTYATTPTLNVNGATIQATANPLSGYALINSTATYPLATNLYRGGVTVDTQAFNTSISSAIVTPATTGLYPAGGTIPASAFASFAGTNANYIAPPLVAITDTNGVTGAANIATGIANVNAAGQITGVTLTNPGQGYAAGDTLTFTFLGGQLGVGTGTSAAYYNTSGSYVVKAGDVLSNAGGGLTKQGAGTLTLSGANTYTGPTAVTAGTLAPTTPGSLPGYNTSGRVTVQSGATLALSVGGTGQFATADIAAVGANVAFQPGSSLALNTSGATAGFTATGAIAGGEGLTKLGANALILAAGNTYTGPTNVSVGTLQLNTPAAIGSTSGVTVAAGASLLVNDNSATAGLAGGVAGGSPVTVSVAGTGVGGNGAVRGPDAGSATFAGSINLTAATSVAAGANGTLTLTAPITGSGPLVFSGNTGDTTPGSTVVLAAQSNYSGETQVNGASNASGATTVRLGTSNALSGSTTLRFLGTNPGTGVLDLAGFNQSVQALAGSSGATGTAVQGIVNSTAGTTSTLTIANGNGSAFTGTIADHLGTAGGTVAVTLAGGTQTLGGTTGTYSGGTTVGSGATLTASSAAAFGTGPVRLAGGTVALGGTITPTTPTLSGFTGFSLNSYNGATGSLTPTVATLTNQATTGLTGGQGTSVYSPQPVAVRTDLGFTASFTYQTSAGVNAGGVAFVLQNDPRGTNAVGSPGNGLGYAYDTGTYPITANGFQTLNSAAVELNDATAYSLGTAFATNGLLTTAYTAVTPVVFNTGHAINATLAYSAATNTLVETLTDPTAATTRTLTLANVNYANALGTTSAYVGFSGGVGAGRNDQTVSNFTFTNLASGPIGIANAVVAAAGTSSVLLTGTSTGFTTQPVGPISVQPAATLTLATGTGNPRAVFATPSVGFNTAAGTTAFTGRLDLGRNDLDVTGQPVAAVNTLVAAGYANGTWAGPGISSTLAAADARHLTAVGVIPNNGGGTAAVYGSGAPMGLFDGANPGPNDVLVRYTYYGDANLDGVVNGADYTRIDAGYASGSSLTGWYNGDFNYDGKVDGSDYTLIDNAFNLQGAALTAASAIAAPTAEVASTGGTAAVPEPVGLALLAVATAAALGRRRTAARR